MSPISAHGSMPPQQQSFAYQRPYSYPQSGPVLSNINNPNGQLALVGGLPQGILGGGYNSGHAASMHHIYAGHAPHSNPHNDRPFRCDQCPQSFNRNHDLKRHKRIHLAVKPFPCGHCDKSFSRKDALKVCQLSLSKTDKENLTVKQRHVLVKGCGKAMATAEVKEMDGSISPKSENSSRSNS